MPRTASRSLRTTALALGTCLLLGIGARLDAAPVVDTPRLTDLSQQVEEILKRRASGIAVGICVRRLSDGEVIYARQADDTYILASNTKLMTTSAALDMLGKEGFLTRLYATGDVDYFGNLDGDLIIAGGGDPTLTGRLNASDMSGVVRRWIATIKETGITSVMGDVVVSHDAVGVGGGEEGQHDALILHVSPAAAGQRARLGVSPSGTSIKVVNSCFTVPGPTRQVKVTRSETGTLYVSGSIGAAAEQFTHILAVGDPELSAASLLRDSLPMEGVPVLGQVRIAEPSTIATDARLLAETRADLAATLDLINKRSHNRTAEELLRIMGARSRWSSDGEATAGRRVVTEFLERSGIDRETFSVGDGSGLSRDNRMSPLSLTQLLYAMSRSRNAETFKASLARPGHEGTLQGRLPNLTPYGKVAAKTGHIRGVNALSGYLDTRRGSYAFSILTNGSRRPPNSLVDELATRIAAALAMLDRSIEQQSQGL